MIKRLAWTVAMVAALGAAAVVAVVAASFALYSWMKPGLGPAGASAGVAAICLVLIAIGGLIARMKSHPKPAPAGKAQSGDMLSNLMNMARERPIIAAGAIIAGAVVAFRNPAITALLVKSIFDSKKQPKH